MKRKLTVTWILAFIIAMLAVYLPHSCGMHLSADKNTAAGAYWLQVSATLLGVLGAALVASVVLRAERREAERQSAQRRTDEAKLIVDKAQVALVAHINWPRRLGATGSRTVGPPFRFLRAQFEDLERPLGVSFTLILDLLDDLEEARHWPERGGPDPRRQGEGWPCLENTLHDAFTEFREALATPDLTPDGLSRKGAEFKEKVFDILLDYLPDESADA